MMVAASLVDTYEDWWQGRNSEPLMAVHVGDPKFDIGAQMPAWMDRSVPGYKLISYALSFCEKEESYRPLQDVLDVLETPRTDLAYLGAAFPSARCDFGPITVGGNISGYAKFDLASKSVWFELDEGWSLERIAALPETASSPWADLCRGAAREIVQRFGGRLLLADSPTFGILDTLAALRTTNQLIEDCIDAPDLVLAAAAALARISWRYWDEMRALLDPVNQGLYSSWGLISRRPIAPCQSDFSVLLSPALYEKLVLPGIREEARRIGRALYHLDGPEQIKYLDLILSIPEIRAIQWPSYPGHPVLSGAWDHLLRKVIDSGRQLILGTCEIPGNPESVRALFAKFPCESFHLTFWVPDVNTGEKLLRAAEQ